MRLIKYKLMCVYDKDTEKSSCGTLVKLLCSKLTVCSCTSILKSGGSASRWLLERLSSRRCSRCESEAGRLVSILLDRDSSTKEVKLPIQQLFLM